MACYPHRALTCLTSLVPSQLCFRLWNTERPLDYLETMKEVTVITHTNTISAASIYGSHPPP